MGNEIENSLNAKQRTFLALLVEGKKVVEAYRAAGYEGEAPAAYMLKSRLEKSLEDLAKARGCSKASLMTEIAQLNDLPVVDKAGNPVTGISMAHKLKLLELQKKTLDAEKPALPKVTAFNVTAYVDGHPSPREIEAEVIERKTD